MVLFAIFVSRFEASIFAEMLRAYGLHVSLDAEAHASVEYISVALGGHRLRVFSDDYAVASEILRQSGHGSAKYEAPKPSRRLVWFVSALGTFYALITGVGVAFGSAPVTWFLYVPFAAYSVPIDPKGKPDYFLATETD